MVKIIQIGDERLREISKPLTQEEIGTKETQKLLEDLSEALRSQDDGVAISAPQIGVNKRIFAVSTKIFDEDYLAGEPEKKFYEHIYFLNPVITKFSKKTEEIEEGCLSIRGVYGLVKRPKNVTIEAVNERGEKIIRGAGGLLARIFQHEIDHLDGILFIDKASVIKEVSEEKNNK
ncbi:MAG: peptide deformylase [Candidatus Paceibacterota bacterium]